MIYRYFQERNLGLLTGRYTYIALVALYEEKGNEQNGVPVKACKILFRNRHDIKFFSHNFERDRKAVQTKFILATKCVVNPKSHSCRVLCFRPNESRLGYPPPRMASQNVRRAVQMHLPFLWETSVISKLWRSGNSSDSLIRIQVT